MSINIPIKLLNKMAKIPERAHDRDAGFDIVAISKKETDKYIQYGTGVAMDIPKGYVGLIFPRSSITNRDLMLKNSVGVIDSGYIGEISFRFYKNIVSEKETNKAIEGSVLNYLKPSEQNVYEIGDRIGQIIFMKLPEVTLFETEELDNSERGEGGYGSTDKKK